MTRQSNPWPGIIQAMIENLESWSEWAERKEAESTDGDTADYYSFRVQTINENVATLREAAAYVRRIEAGTAGLEEILDEIDANSPDMTEFEDSGIESEIDG